jgi:uncharacterized protein YciI
MKSFPRRAFVLALLATSVLSCKATPPEPPKKAYALVFLVTGPKAKEKTSDESRQIMEGHFANIKALSEEGKLLIAGPFAKPVPDERLRGIFVLNTPELGTALAWTNRDPGVKAGVFDSEIALLRTDAPLEKSLELYKAETAEIEKAGKPLGLTDRIRPYALILSKDPEKAERAIANAHAEDKVVFEASLVDCSRGSFFAVLDVKDVAEAEEILGAGSLAEGELVGWWSAKTVAGIARASN